MGGMCDTPALTATLLRRVAHAVDGTRSGADVYVVVNKKSPYKVALVTADRLRAQQEASKSANLCYAGPYKTALEEDPKFVIHCHEPDSDWCDDAFVTDATYNQPMSELPKPTDVEEISVSWKRKDGRTATKTFRWKGLPARSPELGEELATHMVDAVFFTQAAIDKFVVPYICRVQTVRTAFEFRERMRNKVRYVVDKEEQGVSLTALERTAHLQDLAAGAAQLV